MPSSSPGGRVSRFLLPRRLREVPVVLGFTVIAVLLAVREGLGDGGVLLLEEGQVAVRVDHRTGSVAADDRPGTHAFLPWLESVHVLERGTLRLVMGAGAEGADRGSAPLVVRGPDGANYAFDAVEVQVGLDPSQAPLALMDHGGTRGSILRLVDAYARPILRDAFGRFAPREIVLPENKQAGTEAAAEELGAALARHGIELLELSVSKPVFAPSYQQTIQRRKVAEQEIDRLRREREELLAGAGAREAALRSERERRLVELRLQLEESERLARRSADELAEITRRETDARIAAATLARDEALARAEVVAGRARAEAEAFTQRLASVEAQGAVTVKAALVERLGAISFELVPVADRVRDEGAEGGAL
jgi:hypothetical protein